jgi:hypothetical protein
VYGPEAALTVLIGLGAVGVHYIGPLVLVILGLLAILYNVTLPPSRSQGDQRGSLLTRKRSATRIVAAKIGRRTPSRSRAYSGDCI